MLAAVKIVLSHENADFDAVASMLAAARAFPGYIPVLSQRQNANVSGFLALYGGRLPFVPQDALKGRRITHVIVTDTNQIPSVRGVKKAAHVHVIDHHPVTQALDPRIDQFDGEVIGATCTLLSERLQTQGNQPTPLEATLMLLGIYEDTGSLSYGATTPRDIRAAAWLLEQGGDLETVRRFLEPPLNPDQAALLEHFVRTAQTRQIEGFTVMVGTAETAEVMPELKNVAHKLMDVFDPAALFILVRSPEMTNLVARSRHDALDVGAVAAALGGGGHPRAAAAVIRGRGLTDLAEQVWTETARMIALSEGIVRVRDLMSMSAHTVDADAAVADILPHIRRIGHEGYPVMQEGRVAGLLVRGDADRIAAHDLGATRVRDIMQTGDITLGPEATLRELESLMVHRGIGQVPVVDWQGTLLGIVTRTDVMRHWVQTREAAQAGSVRLTLPDIQQVLGFEPAQLIERVQKLAVEQGVTAWLVGGVIRDLLLRRPNHDLDFVVEGDAVAFGRAAAARFGGSIMQHDAFGTAQWTLPKPAGSAQTVDFVSARNEYYTQPARLPTVYKGSIRLDLRRRDFTINALAMHITPASRFGVIVDHADGLDDLKAGVIRILHNVSFVDDPTRIFRAVRYASRLGFTIEPRTLDLLRAALPMLGRVTGERIRNELDAQLAEDIPETGLHLLNQLGVLAQVHPQLAFTHADADLFQRARRTSQAPPGLLWHLWFARFPLETVHALGETLLLGKRRTESLADAAALCALLPRLGDASLSSADAAALLRRRTADALEAASLLAEGNALALERLTWYRRKGFRVRPALDGNDLLAAGVPAGPCVRRLLEHLRDGRLDGHIQSEDDERAEVARLVAGGWCDDPGA
jgi:tRNA nucleotidyltransferase (CCA-adding enzyme)